MSKTRTSLVRVLIYVIRFLLTNPDVTPYAASSPDLLHVFCAYHYNLRYELYDGCDPTATTPVRAQELGDNDILCVEFLVASRTSLAHARTGFLATRVVRIAKAVYGAKN
ncbi:hypothetical protein NM688_g7092 [Phlebia brevispora]|uniref:Uncharacterized protein n=1 Tax=Phlebia brevispora TaxID=194682 RepID=A0ACC1S945_9APHY|nr:hypothetical protein NM688_g7092 [Phlebia brevispora]